MELNEISAGVAVPSTALFTEGDQSYLFVAVGDRRFERRLVAAAPDGEGRSKVTSGLKNGDRVVTNGALLLNFRAKQKQD